MRLLNACALFVTALGCSSAGTRTASGDTPPATTVSALDAPPAAVSLPPPPDDTEDRMRAATAIVPIGTNCLPREAPVPPRDRDESDDDEAPTPRTNGDSQRSFTLGQVDGAVVVCLHEDGDRPYVGLLACWNVDPNSGALTYRDVVPIPGRSFRVRLVHGCAYGYCLPSAADDLANSWAQIGWSTNRKAVAIGVRGNGMRVDLFDAGTKASRGPLPLEPNYGPSNSFLNFAFVEDLLLVTGIDAGPYAGVWSFSTTPTLLAADDPLRSTERMPDRDELLSVYSGGLSVLDDTHALLVETGLMSATVVDVIAHTRQITRRRGVPCSGFELEDFDFGNRSPKRGKCKAALKQLRSLRGAPFVQLASGEYLAAQITTASLVLVDSTTLVAKRTVPLARCKK